MDLCALSACSTYGGPKRAAEPLELELQQVVSLYVGARNQVQALCKNSRCS